MTRETILEIETSLDDCNPQVIGYVLERAFELGALDAYTTPAQMKKGRPGVVVTVLARPGEREALVELLLRETPTLGVRITACEREVLEREVLRVSTAYGEIAVKVAGEKITPEYEDCRAAARRHGVPIGSIMELARQAWRER
jgi:pyridinium-3,5-bisthiocarboxylic acid mononucleotide nickel chelatase